MKAIYASVVASLLAISGCGDDHDHGNHHHGDVSCMGDEDTEGTTLTGTNFKVTLTTVPDPVDPEVNLDFTITVTDDMDAPLDGVTVTAEEWQPVHDHGVPTTPGVVAGSASGTYDISEVYFLHPGRWELRFTVDDGTNSETLTAFICVAGTPPSE